jgi:hypothetical protein
VSPDDRVVIEFCGEGKDDIGGTGEMGPPDEGVVPILVHTLCDRPERMRVKRRRLMHLEGKGFAKKAHFLKRQALLSKYQAVVFVVDSEGTRRDHKTVLKALRDGRDRQYPDFPMAVGVAQPCIESWLLADAAALQRACALAVPPDVPEDPEALPAPCRDHDKNPKAVLRELAGATEAEEKWRIAREIDDLELVRQRCPLGFAPFADEVEERIHPLF